MCNVQISTLAIRKKIGDNVKSIVILDCCGYEVKTNTKSYEYIDCFKTKKGRYFKKKLKDGRMVKREVLLLSVCPKCKHYILNYLWYAKANGRFQDWDENKIIRGKKADEIFTRRIEDYVLVDLPNPFKPKANAKQSMKLSWTYYKTVDSCSQIPRYLNETGDSGLKVVCPIKVTKI